MSRASRIFKGAFVVFFLVLLLTDLLVSARGINLSTPFTAKAIDMGVSAGKLAEAPGVRSQGGPLLAQAGSPSEGSGERPEDVDYPSGLQYGDDAIPDQEFPIPGRKAKDKDDTSTDNPFNPFDLTGTEDGPDENSDPEDDDGFAWYKPWTYGKKVSSSISKWIWSGINNFLLKTIRGAYKSVMGFVSGFVFQDINLATENRVTIIFHQFAWIVGGVFALLIVVVGIKMMMGASFGWNNYRLKLMAPRIVLAAFAAIFALPLCQVFINMAHVASISILGMFQPEDIGLVDPIRFLWGSLITPDTIVIGPFAFILLLFALLGFVFLAIFYVIRRAGLIVLSILAPLAFVLWIDDSTRSYTTLWSKAFFSLVFVEVIHALIVVIFFQTLFSSNDLLANIMYCYALLYLMYKIPSVLFQSTVINWGPKATTTAAGAGAVAGKVASAGAA